MYVRYMNPKTGEMDELHSDSEWVFNENGKVVESRSKHPEEVGRAFVDMT